MDIYIYIYIYCGSDWVRLVGKTNNLNPIQPKTQIRITTQPTKGNPSSWVLLS